MSQMIGMNDTVKFFEEVGDFLEDNDMFADADFPARYMFAMNRLRYLQKRERGAKIKKTKKRNGGYFITCGNCGSGGIEVHYRFCPHCGYFINWKEEAKEWVNLF